MLYFGYGLLALGLFIIISGTIALFRFPDYYTKLHAASVVECAGCPVALFGLSLLQANSIGSFKILVMIVLIFILNPVSTHALARASLLYKIDQEGRIK